MRRREASGVDPTTAGGEVDDRNTGTARRDQVVGTAGAESPTSRPAGAADQRCRRPGPVQGTAAPLQGPAASSRVAGGKVRQRLAGPLLLPCQRRVPGVDAGEVGVDDARLAVPVGSPSTKRGTSPSGGSSRPAAAGRVTVTGA